MELKDLKDYWNGFPEAPYSDTFKWVDQNGYEHMLTVRGWSGSAVLDAVNKAIEAITAANGHNPSHRAPIPAPQNNEPVRVPLDEHGNEQPAVKVASAGRLSWEAKDGKTWFKVMDIVVAAGEKGTKYGVTVWPEVLKAAGLDVSDTSNLPDIHGWRVDYVCNDKGYPQKVTRLLPPK